MAYATKLMAEAALVLIILHGLLNPSIALDVDHYIKCPKGFLANNTVRSDAAARSTLDCFQRCSHTQGCSGVNICTNRSLSMVSCGLLCDVPSTDCEDLTAVTSQACFYAQKVRQVQEVTTGVEETTQTTTEMTTTEIVCQNGGTPNGESCDCAIEYGGRTCHRFIRDCTEAYENGYQSTTDNGAFMIQPISSQPPFSVLCSFMSGGMTLPLRRGENSYFNKDWNTCKVGFGGDLFVNPTSFYFFIGLEKLHQLTRQASYRFELYMKYYNNGIRSGRAIYHNFTIGSESESYARTYDQFDSAASTIDNGFSASPRANFAASGNDHNGCYATKKLAGWYAVDCWDYTIFFNGAFYWTTDGPNSALYRVQIVEFRLVRTSALNEGFEG